MGLKLKRENYEAGSTVAEFRLMLNAIHCSKTSKFRHLYFDTLSLMVPINFAFSINLLNSSELKYVYLLVIRMM